MRRHPPKGLLVITKCLAFFPLLLGEVISADAFDRTITLESEFLTGGGGDLSILVDRGRLDLAAADTPYGHQITLDRGQLTGEGTLSTPVDYINGAVLGSGSELNDMTIEGLVSGSGSLAIIDKTELLDGLSVGGNLYVNQRGLSEVSGPFNVAGQTFITRAGLTLNGELGNLGGTFRVTPMFITAGAFLEFDSSATVDNIYIDPRGAERATTDTRNQLSIADGASLTIEDRLEFFGGVIRGAVLGQNTLTKRVDTVGYLDDFANTGFEQVRVEGGSLVLRGDAGEATPELLLSPGTQATIETTTPFRGTVRLSGRLGVFETGGLRVGNQSAFAGDLYLGTRGQITSDLLTGGRLTPEARIHGGDLHLPGRWPLRIEGGEHTYTGATLFAGGEVTLSGEGRLGSTSEIVGSGRPATTGGRSKLVLDNRSRFLADRIPDTTPITLGGMEFQLTGHASEEVVERLGLVQLGRGVSDVAIANEPGGQTQLVVESLERAGSGSVVFRGIDPDAQVLLEDAPVLNDQMIGPWALVVDVEFTGDADFATYGPNGVVAYSDLHAYRTTLLGVSATDNVSLASLNEPPVLTGDTQINALRTRRTKIDLAGNTLTIESGGLLARGLDRSTLSNGVLTVGDGTHDAELITHGNHQVEASITDNGSSSVGLTHGVSAGNNQADLILAGSNTYSGPTIVNSSGGVASITLTNPKGLPEGGDIVLNGGQLLLDLPVGSPAMPRLGQLTVRDAGRVSGEPSGLSLTSLHFESGFIEVPIVGDTPITKTTAGIAQFSEFGNTLDQHTGPILVEEGLLELGRVGPAPLNEDHAITVRQDAKLKSLIESGLSGRLIRLQGGTLEGEFQGNIEVTSDGSRVNGSFLEGASLSGDGDLLFVGFRNAEFRADLTGYTGDLTFQGRRMSARRANPNYTGTVRVESANFSLLGQGSFGDATIEVTPAGTMSVFEPIDAEIHLAGGVLQLFELGDITPPQLSGGLTVSDDSHIYVKSNDGRRRSPRVSSRVVLNDGSNLVVTQHPNDSFFPQTLLFRQDLRFTSTVEIAGAAMIESFDSTVQFNGTFLSKSEGSTLNLVGRDNTFRLPRSVRLEQGGTLQVTENDQPVDFFVSGFDESFSGSGTLMNDVRLSGRASVSPGVSSVGELIVDGDLTIANGAEYAWEISNPSGNAGDAWDVLRVTGELAIEAPWELQLATLHGAALPANGRWLIAEADRLTGFDPGLVSIIPDESFLQPGDFFEVVQSDNAIYLVSIPEPATMTPLVCALAAVGIGSKRRR